MQRRQMNLINKGEGESKSRKKSVEQNRMAEDSVKALFHRGNHSTVILTVPASSPSSLPQPPKPTIIIAPTDEGIYPVFLFFHGFFLQSSFYSQLLTHISSHGYISVAPQMYNCAGADVTKEIEDAKTLLQWMSNLLQCLPSRVSPDLQKIAVGGHSRGALPAFTLAFENKFSANININGMIGVDPVDTDPSFLLKAKQSRNGKQSPISLQTPSMMIGLGLGELKKNAIFPPCAPAGANHKHFFRECSGRTSSAFMVVAPDYGHMDILDDHTPGLRGWVSHCVCKNGPSRSPCRNFVGGCIIGFLKEFQEGSLAFRSLLECPSLAPIKIDPPTIFHP